MIPLKMLSDPTRHKADKNRRKFLFYPGIAHIILSSKDERAYDSIIPSIEFPLDFNIGVTCIIKIKNNGDNALPCRTSLATLNRRLTCSTCYWVFQCPCKLNSKNFRRIVFIRVQLPY